MLNDLEEILLKENVEILKALKLGHFIAKYYNDSIKEWIECELNGYSDSEFNTPEKFPEYRKLKGFFKQQYIERRPGGYGQVLQIRGANYSKLPKPLPFYESILKAIELSKKEIVELIIMPEDSGNNIPVVIEPSELKNLIMSVNLKLLEYVNEKQISLQNFEEETVVLNLLNHFHKIAKQLEKRREKRHTLKINDEYDVQDLLHALLKEHFDSIHQEEYGPNFAGKRPRIDFFLQYVQLAIEVKYVRDETHAKNLQAEVIQDKEYYSKKRDIKNLYFFIYDPKSHLLNREDFINDLLKNIPETFSDIKIIIKPEL